MRDRRIVFLDAVPDALGRRRFRLEWTGIAWIAATHPDGKPVGYRRAQEFHCRPEPYMDETR